MFMDSDELLKGGVANAGAVVRRGDHVLRPASPHAEGIHAFLLALRNLGFEGVPQPLGIDPDGRERLTFIPGDVAIPPYPAWVQTDAALVSVARLMRRFHEAAAEFAPGEHRWSAELADPEGGTVVCHNDVCLENVVFRNGVAVALLDFDVAAPGRPVYDLAQFARMCIPLDADENAARLGWAPVAHARRLRAVADAYGLDADGRLQLLEIIAPAISSISPFVQRQIDAGDANFINMWSEMGGA